MAQYLKRAWISDFVQEAIDCFTTKLVTQLEIGDVEDRYDFSISDFQPVLNPGRAQIIRV